MGLATFCTYKNIVSSMQTKPREDKTVEGDCPLDLNPKPPYPRGSESEDTDEDTSEIQASADEDEEEPGDEGTERRSRRHRYSLCFPEDEGASYGWWP